MQLPAVVAFLVIVGCMTCSACLPPKCASAPPNTCCFNAKHALYTKYPLLYAIYLHRAKDLVKKLEGVCPCPAPVLVTPQPLKTVVMMQSGC